MSQWVIQYDGLWRFESGTEQERYPFVLPTSKGTFLGYDINTRKVEEFSSIKTAALYAMGKLAVNAD